MFSANNVFLAPAAHRRCRNHFITNGYECICIAGARSKLPLCAPLWGEAPESRTEERVWSQAGSDHKPCAPCSFFLPDDPIWPHVAMQSLAVHETNIHGQTWDRLVMRANFYLFTCFGWLFFFFFLLGIMFFSVHSLLCSPSFCRDTRALAKLLGADSFHLVKHSNFVTK